MEKAFQLLQCFRRDVEEPIKTQPFSFVQRVERNSEGFFFFFQFTEI